MQVCGALADFPKAPKLPVVAVWLQLLGAFAFGVASFAGTCTGGLDLPQRVTRRGNGPLAAAGDDVAVKV
jgi:hypothetical protein